MRSKISFSWTSGCPQKISLWGQNSPRSQYVTYLIFYTSSFVLLSGLILLAYLPFGKSTVWAADGLRQYLPYFIYEGEWLRNLCSDLLSGRGWNPELWSFSMGYGSDVLSTLDLFWNPIHLLSALTPPQYAEYMLQFTVALRLWLAGITFSWYSLIRKNGRFATLCGALLYAFCGTAIFATVWPGGSDGLILFPMLLVGTEKVLSGKRPTLFIVSVALFFIVTYYFAYSACILLIPYCIMRIIVRERANRRNLCAKYFIKTIGKFLLFGCVGVLIACVALVPSAMAVLGTDRATSALVQVPLFYPSYYYQLTFAGWLGTGPVGSDCQIGFGGVAFICCVALFLQSKREYPLKITFIAFSIFLLTPYAGSVFNGFNYATNRWCWAYALCVSYIVVRTIPSLWQLNKQQRRTVAISALLYAIALVATPLAQTKATLAALAMMTLAMILLFRTSNHGQVARRYSLFFTLSACLVVNAWFFASPMHEKGWATNSIPIGSGYQQLTKDSPNYAVTQIKDNSWWRYDANPAGVVANDGTWSRIENDSVVLGLHGIDYYYSIYNNSIDAYHTELAIAGDEVNFRYYDLGGRSMLEVLNNVKYYVTPANKSDFTAYGYDDESHIAASNEVRGRKVEVFQGSNTLPLGYTYSSVIPQSTYLSLTPLQRQEALMQGTVISDSSAENSDLPQTDILLTEKSVPMSISDYKDVRMNDDGSFSVLQPGATITVQADGLSNCETYLYLTGLTCTPQSSYALKSQEEIDGLPLAERLTLLQSEFKFIPPDTYEIYAKADKGSNNRLIKNSPTTYHMYGGKTDWALNLGYSEEAQSSITLTFTTPGRYTCNDIQVVCQPMDNFYTQVDVLKEDVLENTSVEKNSISGTINLDQPKYLYLSIPYSTGWKATVDGQPATIEKANTAFMALPLGAGEHTVELHFMTPGLKEGFALTIAGIAALIGIMLFYQARKKQQQSK